jgi:membrane-anchored mycosin MYCP
MRWARILPCRAASVGAALAALLLTCTPMLLGTDGPALAATGCPAGTSRPAGQRITAEPWAQRRYEPQRLAGIADGTGVTVAVIDSGVDASHRQLRGSVLRGHDFLSGSSGGDGRTDCVAHGTAVASLIAAAPLPGTAFVGLAPGVKILPIRVTETGESESADRAGTASGLAQAIDSAVRDGARVLNISMVLYRDNARVRNAVQDAVRAGAVVVAAAGNGHTSAGGPDPVPYPAAYPGVIGVGAIGEDGYRLADSQVGSYVDVVAPGDHVLAAVPGSGLGYFSGTSFATPFVSATAALILSRNLDGGASGDRMAGEGDQAVREVAARITGSADPAPASQHSGPYGYGVLNPYRAVTEVEATTAAPMQPSPVAGAQRLEALPGADARREALLIAAGMLATAAIVLLLGSVLARGARRRWRTGRV